MRRRGWIPFQAPHQTAQLANTCVVWSFKGLTAFKVLPIQAAVGPRGEGGLDVESAHVPLQLNAPKMHRNDGRKRRTVSHDSAEERERLASMSR